jgi:hypothetical protein
MSISIDMKGDYEVFHALGRRKNKANSKPICAVEAEPAQAIPIPMHDNRDEAATRPSPARWNILTLSEKTKPICSRAK